MPQTPPSIPARSKRDRNQNIPQAVDWLDSQIRWELNRLAPQCLLPCRLMTTKSGDLAQTLAHSGKDEPERHAGHHDSLPDQPLRLLASLRGVLKAERKRGLQGHWSYDLARHSQLLALYRKLLRRHLARTGRPSTQ